MKTPELYQRLPGRRILSMGTRPSLWLASDHLLALERTVGSERYRRFYFRDVEAVIIRRTNRQAVLNAVFLTLACLGSAPFLILFLRNSERSSALVTSVIIGGLGLVLAAVNTVRGATCETRIRTAVQIEPLASLGRLQVVEKVLLRIKPLISHAPGAVTPEQIAAADWSLTRLADRGALVPEPIPREGAVHPKRHESGGMHAGLFATLLIISALSFWEATRPSTLATGLDLSLSLISLLLLIFALRRQVGSDLPAGVKRLTWAALGFFLVGVAAGIVSTFVYAIRHAGEQPTDPLFFRDEPGFVELQIIFGLVALLLGLTGLGLLKGRGRAEAAPSAAVVP